MQTLLDEAEEMICSIADSFHPSHVVTAEDLRQEARVAVMEAPIKFDPARSVAFEGFLYFSVLNHLRQYMSDNQLADVWGSYEPVAIDDEYGLIELRMDTEAALKQLPLLHAVVLSLRFGLYAKAKTLKELGATLGKSTEWARQTQDEALKLLGGIYGDATR